MQKSIGSEHDRHMYTVAVSSTHASSVPILAELCQVCRRKGGGGSSAQSHTHAARDVPQSPRL